MRTRALCAVAVVTCLLAAGARAQDEVDVEDPALQEDPARAAAVRARAADDPSFGPLLEIERIEITGNSRTAERLIRRALLVREGERLRAGDPRLKASRFRVLALGFFADVRLSLRRGSERGRVILTVNVVERGTLTVHRIYLGTSEATPIWAGLDLSDTNLFGTGIGVGAAVVWSDAAEIEGAERQLGAQLRYFDASLFGSRLGAHASFTWRDASEPYRIMGDALDGAPENFRAFGYRRVGGAGGVSWDLTRRSRVIADARVERVDADLPADPAAQGFVLAGESTVVTTAVGFERDTRVDPILPIGGDRVRLIAEYGDRWMGADYRFLKLGGRYERWFGFRGGHVVSLHGGAGVIVGDPPGFDRFYVGDWNRLLAPRPLDLVVSTRPTRDFFGASRDAPTHGDLAGAVELEYSYALFRRTRRVYGGDLFAGVGVFGLGRFEPEGRAIDLTFDVGLRLDTEIGVFELSLANGLGRIPF